MNVLIVELGGSHMENVYTIVHLLYLKNQTIYLACNEKLSGLIKEKDKIEEIFLVPDDLTAFKTQIATFKKIRRIVRDRKVDLIIFGTSEIKPVRNLLPFLNGVKCIGIVHDSQKLENSGTFKHIYPFWIKGYLVFGDYIRNNLVKFPQNKLFPFYPAYFPKPDESLSEKKGKEKWVVVPGIVASERKDYKLLLEKLSEGPFPKNLKLIFLGKFPKEEIFLWSLLHKINANAQNIIVFDDFVNYDIFHNYISSADFLLPLLKISGDSFYNKSRISGAFNLAYGYQLPIILPSSYAENTDLTRYAIYYETIENLIEILKLVSNNVDLESDIKTRYQSGKTFNLEGMANRFLSFISSI